MAADVESILFMFSGLIIGIIVTQLASHFHDRLPYAVVIFVIGVFMALSLHGNYGIWETSVDTWSNIDPEMILFTFLPPLIFGEAMTLNYFHVLRGFWQSFLLAGPGVVIGAVLMGLAVKGMLPYTWSWTFSMLFGTVLSSTDTVAVISLLKGAGASPKLINLIVGESLLNDGSSMILFGLFFNILKGQNYNAVDIFWFGFNSLLGSSFFGIACGGIIVRWMRTSTRKFKEIDSTMQVAITICGGYLIFFISQYCLNQSGALACCFAGVVVAFLSPSLVLNQDAMHKVWTIIEWFGNTLIFLLAGLRFGTVAIGNTNVLDWVIVFVIYMLMMVIRALTVAAFYPILSKIGHKCTVNEAVFIAWGGLRGALPMALALIVQHSQHIDVDSTDTARMFFYVGGVCTLSLIINGSLASRLLDYLKLTGDDSFEKLVITNQTRKRLRGRMKRLAAELEKSCGLTESESQYIRETCTLLKPTDVAGGGVHSGSASALQQWKLHLRGYRLSSRGGLYALSKDHSSFRQQQQQHHHQQQQQSKPSGEDRLSDEQLFRLRQFGEHLATTREEDEEEEAQNNNNNNNNKKKKRQQQQQQQEKVFRDTVSNSQDEDEEAQMYVNNRNRSQSRSRSRSRSVEYREEEEEEEEKEEEEEEENQEHLNRWQARAQSLFRRLSRAPHMDNNNSNNSNSNNLLRDSKLSNDMIDYHRTILLETVRVQYWKDVESGKLPRNSFSARYLLYSIDVGLDKASSMSGVQDWSCIEQELDSHPWLIRALFFLGKMTRSVSILNLLGHYEARWEKRAVYMLTSFIEAHEQAQQKLHAYACITDSEDASTTGPIPPEESRVKEESAAAVALARQRLGAMDGVAVSAIRLRQVSRMLLAKQAALVQNMLVEGLMTNETAEELFDEIETDVAKVEKARRDLYRNQATDRAKLRVSDPDDIAGAYESYSMHTTDGISNTGSSNLNFNLGTSRSSFMSRNPLMYSRISNLGDTREEGIDYDGGNVISNNGHNNNNGDSHTTPLLPPGRRSE